MIAWKRKTHSNGDLDPLVVRLEKRILPCLLSLRRARGLKVGNLRNIVTSLTYGVSDVISYVTMPKTARSFSFKGNKGAGLRRRGFMPRKL